MQFQADILSTNVIRPKVTEVTALGAAYLAGLAVGYWSNMEDISGQWQVDHNFEPCNLPDIDQRIAGWERAVKAAKVFAGH